MPVDTAPLVWDQTDAAFKIETTTGTPEALTAAEGKTNVFNADMKFTTEKVERPGQGKLSPIRQGLGARMAKFGFETEAHGGGAAQPVWAPLLQMCGLAVTAGVYTPKTRPTVTGTFGHWRSGRCKRMSGAMGNSVWTFARGKAPRIKWDFSGVSQPPGDVAQITPAYDATIAPEATAVFTIGGSTYFAPEVVFDQGNAVVMRQSLAGVDEDGNKTGYRSASITGRRPTFKIAPEALPLTTQDWYDIFLSRTTVALAITAGDTAGNTILLEAPKLELDVDPEDLERDGMLADSLTFLALRETDAGDDEYSITIGVTA